MVYDWRREIESYGMDVQDDGISFFESVNMLAEKMVQHLVRWHLDNIDRK